MGEQGQNGRLTSHEAGVFSPRTLPTIPMNGAGSLRCQLPPMVTPVLAAERVQRGQSGSLGGHTRTRTSSFTAGDAGSGRAASAMASFAGGPTATTTDRPCAFAPARGGDQLVATPWHVRSLVMQGLDPVATLFPAPRERSKSSCTRDKSGSASGALPHRDAVDPRTGRSSDLSILPEIPLLAPRPVRDATFPDRPSTHQRRWTSPSVPLRARPSVPSMPSAHRTSPSSEPLALVGFGDVTYHLASMCRRIGWTVMDGLDVRRRRHR